MSKPVRVTVWNEYRHEKDGGHVASRIYPDGMHVPIANWLRQQGMDVGTATLDEPEHGLTQGVLDNTDVLVWWGHLAHHEVSDEIVDRVQLRVLSGMGLVVLHSGHHSKVFRRLMGTTGHLKWREADERERIWVVEPCHPIAAGIDRFIELDRVEMYGERFDIPAPDTLVFISWFEGGNVFRSGCCWNRGRGRIFYFRPGHESFPHFHNEQILRVISNAVEWAVADNPGFDDVANERNSLEPISAKD